jgi:hypothetical protein
VPGPASPGSITITVRLLYRNLPPYLLRALAAHQPPTDPVMLGPLIGNLQVVEMQSQRVVVTLP